MSGKNSFLSLQEGGTSGGGDVAAFVAFLHGRKTFRLAGRWPQFVVAPQLQVGSTGFHAPADGPAPDRRPGRQGNLPGTAPGGAGRRRPV